MRCRFEAMPAARSAGCTGLPAGFLDHHVNVGFSRFAIVGLLWHKIEVHDRAAKRPSSVTAGDAQSLTV